MVKPYGKRVRQGRYLIPKSRLKSHGGYRQERKYYGSHDFNILKPLMIEKYHDLTLFIRNNPKQNEYKYLVTTGALSNEAFYTENGLKRYLKRTGLKKQFVSSNDNGRFYRLIGSYEEISMAGNYKLLNEFGKKKGLTRTKVMSNGDYTTGYYGGGKIYYLNSNYPRTIYNYFWE